ncbi:type III-A CRISPR-associated RAMP protein Csm5 [Aggregatilinea lenta]|uniref:type III-A CRISPR-associated RAMP protein Csm5 n=1 Tax=Aggregatilinea lenta TaxID=913108 RepID=UPI000E5C3F99|nr:type III-A CRISPR-associated RAMP protein Csm5 [Aggregatilinea lenta]
MPFPLHTQAQITVEILSPTHIGDGHRLMKGIDFVTHRGRTWLVDEQTLLDRILGMNDSFTDSLLGRPIDELLVPEDFDHTEFFRYVMHGEPVNNFIESHIKTVFGQPYIPGSSIKGLLRTLFIWGWHTAQKTQPDLTRLGGSRSWAAQAIEREVMGANPNLDLFRALHVADSEPGNLNDLTVTPVSIFPTGRQNQTGVVVDVEALKRGTTFVARMSIEEYGFEDGEALKRLGWVGKRHWLDRLVPMGRAFGGRRLAQEIDYFRAQRDGQPMLNFYYQLAQRHEVLAKNQFLAQMGWGAGWNSKTLNDLLLQNEQEFAGLVRRYNLKGKRDRSQSFGAGDLFPASRHVTNKNLPVGWVLVTVNQAPV